MIGNKKAGRLGVGAPHRWLSLVVLCALGVGAAAQEEEDPPLGWSGNAAFGFTATTGNAESSNLTLGLGVEYRTKRWLHEFIANALRASGQEESTGEVAKTAERYQFAYQGNWALTDRSYLFGRANFDRDLFSGVRRNVSQTLGYGHTILALDRHTLDIEAGLGAKQLRRDDDSELNEAILRTGFRYGWQISENSQFRQSVFVEAGQENIFTESITELQARLIGNLAMAVSYTLRNNTDVSPTAVQTDTFTTINLQYTF
jgi:putative salt-induced outer membrane protein